MTLPEGRQPLSWQDIPFSERPKAHPSTERLEIEKLRERVAELEAALRLIIPMTDAISLAPSTADRWADRIEDVARTALQEGG